MEYNEITSALKKAEPALNNAEELTNRIMQRIELMPMRSGQFRIWGFISGAAASVLICLFAYETMKFPAMPAVNHSERESVSFSNIHSEKIVEHDVKEKWEIIETVVRNKKVQRMRKEQLNLSLSSLNLK
jgi:hypothetical protein